MTDDEQDQQNTADPTPNRTPTGAAARPGTHRRWLWAGVLAGIVCLVAGAWVLQSSSNDSQPARDDPVAAVDAFLSSVGCQDPQFGRKEGDEAATWVYCADGSEVAFFDGQLQQQNYMLRAGSSGRSGGYVIVGPGWSVVTDDIEMATSALEQGGQRLL